MCDNKDEIVIIEVNLTKRLIKIADNIIPLNNIIQQVGDLNKNDLKTQSDDIIVFDSFKQISQVEEVKETKETYKSPLHKITVTELLDRMSKLKKTHVPVPLAYITSNIKYDCKGIKCYTPAEYYKQLLKKDPSEIKNVPNEHMTEELAFIVVSENGHLLKYIDEKFHTKKVVLAAVTQHGNSLNVAKYTDDEIYNAAIEQTPWAIQHIPNKIKYYEKAISKDPTILKLFQNCILDEDTYKNAVKKNGFVIKYIPGLMQTIELCCLALNQNEEYKSFITNEKKEYIINVFQTLKTVFNKN